MIKLILLIILLFTVNSFASPLPCKPWQILVKEQHVSKHHRSNAPKVSAYDKKTFCRERFSKADFWVPRLFQVNTNWKSTEILRVLETLSTLPEYLEVEITSIHRLAKGEILGNPASSDLINKSISLYGIYFNKNSHQQKAIISHELAHFLYQKLTPIEKEEFIALAGWKLGNVNLASRKVELIQPSKLIKPDSAINPEEDFANHIEVYIENPLQIKNHNINAYNFLTKRFFK